MRTPLRQFDKGLWLASPGDAIPQGTMRRNRGIHPLSKESMRSRSGSMELYTLANVHSIYYFADSWVAGASTIFYYTGATQYTTFTEVDIAADRVTVEPSLIYVNEIDTDENVWVYKDYTAAFFDGDFEFRFNFKCTVVLPSSICGLWALTNDLDGLYGLANADKDHLSLYCTSSAGQSMIPALVLRETNGATDTIDTSIALVVDTIYYIKIVRDDDAGTHGSLVCTIYSDAKWSVIVDTLTVTLTEQQDFRYFFNMISYDGTSGGNPFFCEIGDLQIVTPDVGLSSVKTGLSGDRLSMVKMAPVAGITDYLFIAGGEDLFKTTNAGAVSNWGIVAPDANPSAAEGAAGAIPAGTYQYKITFKDSTTGHRSDPNPTAASVTINVDKKIDLTSIDTTTDTQADKVEIWRTVVGGSIFFYLAEINEGTTVYEDNNLDSALSTTELPTDNLHPYTWFDDCIGPHNASMFWITRTQSGNRGRMYYSPIGRAESVQGFIEVTSDDDGLQKLVQESGMLGVFSKSGFFRILGTNPYTVQEISGMPGTTKPHTVVVTPLGIVYEAADGVRLLRGLQSTLINPDAVNRLFRGEDVENLTSFSGLVAAYARGEYFISDGSQTLAVNLRDGTWRDVGYGSDAYFYAEELDILALSNKAKILDFEKEGTSDDDGTDIDVSIEPSLLRHDNEKESIIQHIHIDSNTADETLAVTLITDNSTVSLGNLSTSSRSVTTFNVGKTGQVVGVRLAGSLSEKIEVFGVDVDSYVPGEVRA